MIPEGLCENFNNVWNHHLQQKSLQSSKMRSWYLVCRVDT